MSEEVVIIHQCSHIGVASTTPVHVKRLEDGTFKARCGIAIMSIINVNDAEFEACGYNPFHPEFQANLAEGDGATEEEAFAALKADIRQMMNNLWI